MEAKQVSGFGVDKDTLIERIDLGVYAISLLLWAVVIYYASTQAMPRAQFGILFLGCVFTIFIFDELKDDVENSDFVSIGLLLISQLVVIVTTIYMAVNFTALIESRVGYALPHEYALLAVFAVVVIYLTYRSFGSTFVALVVGGILYGYFGDLIPGILGHGGMSHTRLLLILGLDLGGFYGFLTQLVAAWIALFLLYAGLLKAYGAYDLILNLAMKSTKYVSTGVALTAVIASAIIGSINGSHTANAGMTGSFTIPTMKKNGIKPETAGGIEAVASTLGQVLPPVMGAGAFIMASLLGISYVSVLVAGLLPAGVLTIAVVFAVHNSAIDQIEASDMSTVDEHREKMSRPDMVANLVMYGLPFFALIYFLGILQYTVMTSALYTAVSMMILGTVVPLVQTTFEGNPENETIQTQFTNRVRKTIDGAKFGALITAPIAIILAAINGIVDIFLASGVPGAISLSMMSLSGGSLLVAALMAFAICIVLGLGMPTSAAYTLVGLLIAPTLITQFLLPDLTAHYFVFYVTILAGITPPIATAAAVTAGIAGAKFWNTCFEAVKIAAPLYIVPFSFIWHPEMVSNQIGITTLTTSVLILLGALSVAFGTNRHISDKRLVNLALKAIITIAGTGIMVHPSNILKLGLIAIAIPLMIITVKFDYW